MTNMTNPNSTDLPALPDILMHQLSHEGLNALSDYARAAIEADRASRSVAEDREGFVLVPRELTEAMLHEWEFQAGVFRDRRKLWSLILGAAPSQIAAAPRAAEVQVMLNGLTEAETNASASVSGLSRPSAMRGHE